MIKPKRKLKWIRYPLILAVGFGVYQFLTGPSGAVNLFQLWKNNANQQQELDSLTQRRAELQVEKVRLQKDSAYIEHVARKDLGMAKPGEKVFRFMGSEGQKGTVEKIGGEENPGENLGEKK